MKKLFLGFTILTAGLVLLAQPVSFDKRVKVLAGKVVTEYYTSNMLVRVEAVSVKTNKDGSPIAGYTKLYQEGREVLDENWGPGLLRQRTFFRDGKRVLTETDKNGDGIPEWVVVSKENGQAESVFKCDNFHKIELLGTNAAVEYDEGLEMWRAVGEVITNRLTDTNSENLNLYVPNKAPEVPK